MDRREPGKGRHVASPQAEPSAGTLLVGLRDQAQASRKTRPGVIPGGGTTTGMLHVTIGGRLPSVLRDRQGWATPS